jgi:hypothetical protein
MVRRPGCRLAAGGWDVQGGWDEIPVPASEVERAEDLRALTRNDARNRLIAIQRKLHG